MLPLDTNRWVIVADGEGAEACIIAEGDGPRSGASVYVLLRTALEEVRSRYGVGH